jgi:cardiolipin synthase A/B
VAQDPEHWRDMQIRIQGPGVLPLQTGFAHWLQTTGELVSGNEYYQPLERPAGQVALQTLLSSPQTGASAVRIMYYLAIVSARRYIYIANPYFVPDQAAIEILNAARKRGVDVKIMISGTFNDSRLARYNSRRLYGAVLGSGIEIYEFNRTMLHHKIMVIDDAWGTVGTANFDNRSFAHNEESNICFYDPVATEQLRNTFLQDIGGCNRVTLADWRNRGLPSKLMESAMSLLEDQV